MRLLVLALAALAALFGRPAEAEPANCLPPDDMRALLGGKWGEGRNAVAIGQFIGEPAIYETFANPDTGTWTMTVTRADGMSCIIAVGTAWEEVNDLPADASEERS